MKKVKQLQQYPAGIKEFFRLYPQERNWDKFRNYTDYKNALDETAYEELRKTLADVQHGLCVYCEADLIAEYKNYPPRIEHFCPKSFDKDDNVNWTLEIVNLFAACQGGTKKYYGSDNTDKSKFYYADKGNKSCDAVKNDKVPDLCVSKKLQNKYEVIKILKPSDIPERPVIFKVTINGEHEGKLSENRKQINDNEITDKAKNTIIELNLNCDRLVDARIAVIYKLKEASYSLDDNASDEQIKQSQIELAKQFLFDKDGKPAEFFTTIRAFFKEIAEDILSKQPQSWI